MDGRRDEGRVAACLRRRTRPAAPRQALRRGGGESPGRRGAPTVTCPVMPVMRATFLPFTSSPSSPGAAAQAHASAAGCAAILPATTTGAAQVRR